MKFVLFKVKKKTAHAYLIHESISPEGTPFGHPKDIKV